MRPALLLAVTALAAAAPLGAQRAPDAQALLAEAERLREVDDARALRLVEQALPLLARPEDRALRLKALALQCWTSAGSLESGPLVALAERGMAEARAAGDARAYADLRLCRGATLDEAAQEDSAALDYEFAIAEARRLDVPALLATALAARGNQRYYRGDLGGALEDLNAAYAIYQRLRDNRACAAR